MNMFQVEGKTAVVTGGTGVLGQAMAQGLAKAGARVVIMGRRKEAGEKIVEDIRGLGQIALFVQADVLNAEELTRANDIIIKEFGSIDILVNAAGGNMAGAVISPTQNFFDLNMTEFGKVVDLNLTGRVDGPGAGRDIPGGADDQVAAVEVGSAGAGEVV